MGQYVKKIGRTWTSNWNRVPSFQTHPGGYLSIFWFCWPFIKLCFPSSWDNPLLTFLKTSSWSPLQTQSSLLAVSPCSFSGIVPDSPPLSLWSLRRVPSSPSPHFSYTLDTESSYPCSGCLKAHKCITLTSVHGNVSAVSLIFSHISRVRISESKVEENVSEEGDSIYGIFKTTWKKISH